MLLTVSQSTLMSRKVSHDVIFLLSVMLLVSLFVPVSVLPEDIADLKKGVVKITAQVEGKEEVGTGFIVRLEKDIAYIVTASHVIEGDSQPKVVFYPKQTRSFPARVLGLDGGNPRGLASLLVEGDLPAGLQALPLNPDFDVSGGEPVTMIGFPRTPPVAWAVTPGVMTGQAGQNLVFSGAAVSGHSGGPLVVDRKGIGVVTEVTGQYGYAVPVQIVSVALRRWGVTLGEALKDIAQTKEKQLSGEITGKDSAPMVLIPAGEFWMGSPDGEGDNDEHPRHRVALSPFFLDQYEVTNKRFEQFIRDTGHRTTAEQEGKASVFTPDHLWKEVSGANWRNPEGSDMLLVFNRYPVVSVSWEDAAAYCRWAGKRLPTEAEFEYATRAGTETKYWWGNEGPGSRRVANIGDESMKREYSNRSIMTGYDDGRVRMAPVGSYEANPFGLHDMIGNVWEWTADWYNEQYYETSPKRNPTGPLSGQYRVLRGGSWTTPPESVRSAIRGWETPAYRNTAIGFRCARNVPQ